MAIDSSPSISVHITITIDPSNNAAFLEALKPTFEAATKEPLNTYMEVFQDANTPGVFRIVENWNASIDYMMNVQRNKDYYKPYFAAIEPMYLKPLEATVYNRFEGKQLKCNKETYYNTAPISCAPSSKNQWTRVCIGAAEAVKFGNLAQHALLLESPEVLATSR